MGSILPDFATAIQLKKVLEWSSVAWRYVFSNLLLNAPDRSKCLIYPFSAPNR
jgi:hypothetical protein